MVTNPRITEWSSAEQMTAYVLPKLNQDIENLLLTRGHIITAKNAHYEGKDLMEVIGGILHQKPMDREYRKKDILRFMVDE